MGRIPQQRSFKSSSRTSSKGKSFVSTGGDDSYMSLEQVKKSKRKEESEEELEEEEVFNLDVEDESDDNEEEYDELDVEVK